jgi:hypothetical protein
MLVRRSNILEANESDIAAFILLIILISSTFVLLIIEAFCVCRYFLASNRFLRLVLSLVALTTLLFLTQFALQIVILILGFQQKHEEQAAQLDMISSFFATPAEILFIMISIIYHNTLIRNSWRPSQSMLFQGFLVVILTASWLGSFGLDTKQLIEDPIMIDILPYVPSLTWVFSVIFRFTWGVTTITVASCLLRVYTHARRAAIRNVVGNSNVLIIFHLYLVTKTH